MYKTIICCPNCEKEVKPFHRVGNQGKCPHCGAKSEGAGNIICAVVPRMGKTRRRTPWWAFWQKKPLEFVGEQE